MRRWLPLPFLAVLGLAATRGSAPLDELELVYLANEGFLARAGGRTMVVDAFLTEPYSIYAAVPRDLWAKMTNGAEAFERVDLALVSHHHRDHFQPASAGEFLRAHPETALVSSPQVVDELIEALQEGAEAGAGDERVDELEARLPEAGKRELWKGEAGTVEFLRLPHGGGRNSAVQNLGQRIELGGARLLHLGDADLATSGLEAYALEAGSIDVAFVPYWWLADSEAVRRTLVLTGARRIVAVHVPPGELAEVRAHLATLEPEITLFERPGETRRIPLGR